MTTEVTRKPTSTERAAAFMDAAADVTTDDLLTAARVLRAIADVDLRELERAMSTDSCGNPITRTDEQRDAWATYCAAMDRRDRADGWARDIERAAQLRCTCGARDLRGVVDHLSWCTEASGPL